MSVNQGQYEQAADEAVNENRRRSTHPATYPRRGVAPSPETWPVYRDQYEIRPIKGRRYVVVPTGAEAVEPWRYEPLSTPYMGLFLDFANVARDGGLDKHPLDTDRNAAAALSWADEFGVLGLTPGHARTRPMVSSVAVTSAYLDDEGLEDLALEEQQPDGRGGYPGDSVERFALEAWDAFIALRLYEAATAERGPDVDAIRSYVPETYRNTFTATPAKARDLALAAVDDYITAKVAGRVYPVVHPATRGAAAEQGWGFNSLLGALWTQMLWLRTAKGERRCRWCGAVIAIEGGQPSRSPKKGARGKYRTRPDRIFCDNNNRCKQKYHNRYSGAERARERRGGADTRL